MKNLRILAFGLLALQGICYSATLEVKTPRAGFEDPGATPPAEDSEGIAAALDAIKGRKVVGEVETVSETTETKGSGLSYSIGIYSIGKQYEGLARAQRSEDRYLRVKE